MATYRLSDVSATAAGRVSRGSMIGESDRFRTLMFRIGEVVMQYLQHYEWPGNVRELENVLERAGIVSHDGTLDHADDLSVELPATDALVDVERAHIPRILSLTGGRIEGDGGAARTLGLKPSTLRSRMRKLGIARSSAAP